MERRSHLLPETLQETTPTERAFNRRDGGIDNNNYREMTKAQLAVDLIKEKSGKDGKCTLSKKALGKILHQRYPADFQTPERGRKTILDVTGANGDLARKEKKIRIEWKGLSLP